MVQIISSKQFGMQSFAFQRGVSFEHHDSQAQLTTLDSLDISGLRGGYSFTHSLALWNGPSTLADADNAVVYAGDSLVANAAGTPTGGKVTGMLVESGSLGSYLIGTALGAVDIFEASQTDSREDDMALLRFALRGNDRVTLSAFDDVVASQNGNDIVNAGAGDDSISGNSGGDTLFGQDGDDLIDGGFGYDQIFGGLGRDVIYGREGSDRIRGNQGGDSIDGAQGNDRLFGGYGYDKIFAGTGRDTLDGGYGQDVLYGGADSDVDVFVFSATGHSPTAETRDVVHDFVSRIDILDLSGMDANTAQAGDQAFVFNGQDVGANAVWYRTSGTSVIVSADVNGDSQADFSLRVTGSHNLSPVDFIL